MGACIQSCSGAMQAFGIPAVHKLGLLEALQVGWHRSQTKGVESK